MSEKDQTMPKGKWEFDGSVTEVFDDMLTRSIPDYTNMRKLCRDVGRAFVKPKSDVVDLGCSRGEALADFVNEFGAHNRFLGVEVSPPMLEAVRARFSGYINCGIVDVRDLDLRKAYPSCLASLTLAVLTIQFTPIEYRQKILRNVYHHTLPGGAFILVEKLIGATADLDEMMKKIYYDMKAANGYTQDQIERKRLALEGVLVPMTSKWNEDLLRAAGFSQIDCFWRHGNFGGWVAIRD